jgi:hypothetical protein
VIGDRGVSNDMLQGLLVGVKVVRVNVMVYNY